MHDDVDAVTAFILLSDVDAAAQDYGQTCADFSDRRERVAGAE